MVRRFRLPWTSGRCLGYRIGLTPEAGGHSSRPNHGLDHGHGAIRTVLTNAYPCPGARSSWNARSAFIPASPEASGESISVARTCTPGETIVTAKIGFSIGCVSRLFKRRTANRTRSSMPPRFDIASSSRASGQVCDAPDVQALGHFPELLLAGGEEATKQTTRAELLQPAPPALGATPQTIENAGQFRRDRGFSLTKEPPNIIDQKEIVTQREPLEHTFPARIQPPAVLDRAKVGFRKLTDTIAPDIVTSNHFEQAGTCLVPPTHRSHEIIPAITRVLISQPSRSKYQHAKQIG